MATAKARPNAKPKERDKKPKLVAINIQQARKIISTLKKHEKDRDMIVLLDCLDRIFDSVYGGVLVCQENKAQKPILPCCGMC